MLEGKIVYFLAAFFLSLSASLAAFKEFPGDWLTGIAIITALAQGLLVLRAFTARPPGTTSGGSE